VSGVTVDVDSTEISALLAQLKERTSDTQPAMAAIGRFLVSKIQMGFRTSRDPWGNAWAALKFRSGQPLRDTGRLRNSIHYAATPQEVTVGTNVSYAAVHQFGAVIKPKTAKALVFTAGGRTIFARSVTVPARPFMPIGQPLPDSWEQGIKEALSRAILAADAGGAQ
jgi:phage virion morphogenesis protein